MTMKSKEQDIFSMIGLLIVHFAQWSFHISFLELTIIFIMRLNKFNERSTLEGLKLVVKCFIKQAELNIEFVQSTIKGGVEYYQSIIIDKGLGTKKKK